MPSIINATTTNGLVTSADNSGSLQLQTNNGTTAVTINTSQGVQFLNSISVGNATPSTSGAGITFPATQSASTDANTLDDYEEGTFTPVLSGSGSAPTVTYNNRYGYYTKIGRMVYISLRIQVNTISGGSGSVVITGLPFTSASEPQHNLGGTFASGLAWGGSTTQLSPWVPGNTSTVQFRGLLNNGSNADTEVAGVSSGDYMDAQGWYFV